MSVGDVTVPMARGALFAALAKAQAKIRTASKDSKNPHFNSKYADLASVAEACREALTENGICVLQDPSTEGNQVTCVTTLGHSSGESYESKPLAMVPRDLSPQSVGSCVTYLRRYQLASVVGVAPDDDDGNAAQGGASPKGDAGGGKATPPVKEAPQDAGKGAGTATSSTAPATTPTRTSTMMTPGAVTGPTTVSSPATGKAPRPIPPGTPPHYIRESGALKTAADIEPTGGPLDPGQLKRIHQLKDAIGGRYSGDGADARDGWAKALNPFRSGKGGRCSHSNELSKDQATFLIWRMENLTARQATRAEQPVDVAPVTPIRPPTLWELLQRHLGDEPEHEGEWLYAMFGKGSPHDLTEDEAASALALLMGMATSPDAYDAVETKLREQGKLR